MAGPERATPCEVYVLVWALDLWLSKELWFGVIWAVIGEHSLWGCLFLVRTLIVKDEVLQSI